MRRLITFIYPYYLLIKIWDWWCLHMPNIGQLVRNNLRAKACLLLQSYCHVARMCLRKSSSVAAYPKTVISLKYALDSVRLWHVGDLKFSESFVEAMASYGKCFCSLMSAAYTPLSNPSNLSHWGGGISLRWWINCWTKNEAILFGKSK